MEEAHDHAAHGVNAREVGALVEIAPVTRERKIIQVVFPAVLASDYVFDVMLLIDMLLTEQAVLAAVIRAAADGIAASIAIRWLSVDGAL